MDRRWWVLTRALLHGKVKLTHVPALRSPTGEWITDPKLKANLFRDTWERKMRLPPEHPDAFFFATAHDVLPASLFLQFRTRACLRIFESWM